MSADDSPTTATAQAAAFLAHHPGVPAEQVRAHARHVAPFLAAQCRGCGRPFDEASFLAAVDAALLRVAN